jgi:hypothetical protein
MNWPRLFAYLVLLGIAYCEENDIPLRPLLWHYLTIASLKLSNAFWNAGIFTAQQYRKAIEVNG